MILANTLLSNFVSSFTYHKFDSKPESVLNSHVQGIHLSAVRESSGGTDLSGVLLLSLLFWRQIMLKNIQVFSDKQNDN